jgi:hypothetical protein
MSTITLENPYYYQNGVGGVSAIVGSEGGATGRRVVRYEFTAPNTGASHVAFSLTYAYLQSYSAIKPLRFYIGTSSTSHAAAGSDYDYTGTVNSSQYQTYEGCYVFTGEANVVLSPSTKYYLWIFPSTDEGWCYYNAATITEKTIDVSGGAGLVYIYNGSSWDAYQIYIYNGTGWDLYLPYIYNGSDWDLYT